jgi:hypothetical protein
LASWCEHLSRLRLRSHVAFCSFPAGKTRSCGLIAPSAHRGRPRLYRCFAMPVCCTKNQHSGRNIPRGPASPTKCSLVLTQAKAAKLQGVSQSRVSDLARGKWEKSSLEMLITLATSTRHVPRRVRRGGSGERGCVPSPSGAVLPRSACLGVGGEAVHGRKEEETGHRRKGTVWVEGDDFE